MEYTKLGNTGLEVSRICLGMMSYGDPGWRNWVLSEEEATPIVERAVDAGINFFDTADMYSMGVSEEVTGNLLADCIRRDEVVIATKVYFTMKDRPNRGGLGRKHILEGVRNSLQRLGTDYIDLYQIHRWDYETPIEETLEALHDCVRKGYVRYIGASSMHAYQFAKSLYTADLNGWTRFVSMQNHYNLLYREEEREMLRLCEEEGIGVIPWSPLARGWLARPPSEKKATERGEEDSYSPQLYDDPQSDAIIERVGQVAENRGISRAQVALAWLLHQPAVTAPIVGATKMEHLEDAIGAVDVELTDDEIELLEEPYEARPVRGHE
ncbi:MAG: aldo/keto reductase [Longimicrobiales bacterium]|nr:aldo/keto reductase [Longimicrobiales bacterium]